MDLSAELTSKKLPIMFSVKTIQIMCHVFEAMIQMENSFKRNFMPLVFNTVPYWTPLDVARPSKK